MSDRRQTDRSVWALLRKNISKAQLFGYAIANIVGLTIILSGIMFYLDSNNSTKETDAFFSSDYIVISKKIDGLGFRPVTFSPAEIEDLRNQPWVKKIGKFTSSQFAVKGAVDMGGRGMSSYLFFESVPDDFFDVKPRDWRFDPADNFIPIILSKDYLALYNFGFAVPQGLPQVSEDIISAIPVRLSLTGAGRDSETFDAAIVGFSSRLNTIAVPQSFMDWANQRYSSGSQPDPSRLIVEVDRLNGADMPGYFSERDIEVAGDKGAEGNISRFLTTASLVVTINGLIISSLAIFILMLSIFLLLQKSKEKLRYLMLLGYSPRRISSYYVRMVVVANSVVTLIAIAVVLSVRQIWNSRLADMDLGDASVLPMLAVAAVYLIAITLLNVCTIRRYVMRIWRG